MRDYRAYRLDLTGRIVGRIEFVHADDESAIIESRDRLASWHFELWQADRLVFPVKGAKDQSSRSHQIDRTDSPPQ